MSGDAIPAGGIRMADERRPPASGRWLTFVDGPLAGQRHESGAQPNTSPAQGGTYVRSVRCADDGDLRYIFHEAGR